MCFGGVWLAPTVKMEYVGLLASGTPSKNTICIHVFLAVRPEQHTHTKLHMCTSDFLAGNSLPVLHQAWNKKNHMVFAKHVFIHCILCQAFFFIYCMLKQCNGRSPMFSSVFFLLRSIYRKFVFLQLGINKEKPKLMCLISFFNSLNSRAFRNVL